MKSFACLRAACAALLCAIPAYSQTLPDSAVFHFPLSAETLPRYNDVCARLAERPVMTGIFTQKKTLTRINRSLVSGGNFIFDAHSGIVWETLRPFPSAMAVGRDYIIQSLPGGKKTKLDAAGNEVFMRFSETLRAVFTGDAHRLREDFENYFTEERGLWTIGLVPSEKALKSFAAAIVMSGDSALRSITLYEQNGDILQYELSGHSFPGELNAREKAFFSPAE